MIVQRCITSDLPARIAESMRVGSLYSSPEFAALWTAQSGLPVTWIIKEQEQILAALSGVEFRPRPVTRFQAMPDGLYSGLWKSPDCHVSDDEIRKLIMGAISSHGYARIYIADFDNQFHAPDKWHRLECNTSLLEIAQPNWEPPDATLRSEIRKAEREGVTCVPYDREIHEAGFLKLVRATETRHGRDPKYSAQFFQALADLVNHDDRVVWQVITHENQIAASQIYLVDHTRALYWQAYFDKNYSFLKPNQYMLYTVATQLASRGVKTLNLGSSAGGADGLALYKEKWGGTNYGYRLLMKTNWLGTLL
jgi:hypothetical protein